MNPSAKKIVHSITAFTLLDYPDKTACILWFAGCNMRCGYCYNPEIVFGKGNYTLPEVLSFLERRKNLLDAVVFSGGECLLYKDVIQLMEQVKGLGFLVKVDTNGSCPQRLQEALESNLLDYVALDFKATQSKIKSSTQADFYSEFILSLKLLIQAKIPFEVRTTVHSELLTEADLIEMIRVLTVHQYTGNYYLQGFRNGVDTIKKMNPSHNKRFAHLTTSTIWIQMR